MPPAQVGPPPFPKPPTHLAWAVLSMLLCCVPLGIVAVVHAARVDTKWAAGDWIGAAESSLRARTWAQCALFAGIVVVFLYQLATAWAAAGAR
ncbi:MAG: CD225/dispanin family protein [Acidimicrobiales bacterium]|jgi:hypothetical protein|nr:CD225/dispanin family protein [Acidimicrobiales bacterium]